MEIFNSDEHVANSSEILGRRLLFPIWATDFWRSYDFFSWRYKTNSSSVIYMNILFPPQYEVSHLSFPPSIHCFWWYIPEILMGALMLRLCFFSDSMTTNSLCINTTPWTRKVEWSFKVQQHLLNIASRSWVGQFHASADFTSSKRD